jgi:hypothetical protein
MRNSIIFFLCTLVGQIVLIYPHNTAAEEPKSNIINGDILDVLEHNPVHKKPIQKWARAIAIRQTCHSKMADTFHRKDKFLNTISVSLNAITSSVIFTSIAPNLKPKSKAILAVRGKEDEITSDGVPPVSVSFPFVLSCTAGFISLVNTVLQAVGGCLNYAQLAEQHHTAFKLFTKMRYRLEIMVGSTYEDDGHIVASELKDWIHDYGEVLESAPIIPQEVFDKARKEEEKKENEYFEKQRRNMAEEGSKQCPKQCPKDCKVPNNDAEEEIYAGHMSPTALP